MRDETLRKTLYEETQTGLKTLHSLYKASSAITAAQAPPLVLQQVVAEALNALTGWRAQVALLNEAGELESKIEIGFATGIDTRGFIRKNGISAQVMYTGKLWYTEDAARFADRLNPALLADGVKAAVCAPLHLQGRSIGVMWLHFSEPRSFLPIEIEALRLYANQAAIAYHNAQLATAQTEQNDHLRRMIDSSPNGIVAVDKQGIVLDFNQTTLDITGYSAAQLRGRSIHELYFREGEARQVGRLLHERPDSLLHNYETLLRTARHEGIPIRLSVTGLYDAHQNRIGSVGYFEDLRASQETEKRFALLLRASNLIAQTEDLTVALHSLAQMLAEVLDITYCRISLLSENKQVLIAKAAYARLPHPDMTWNPKLGVDEKLEFAQWYYRADALKADGPTLLRREDPAQRAFLTELARVRGFETEIQALLLLPLRTSRDVVGLLALGELRSWARAPILAEKQNLAAAIADQAAVLIERISTYERHKTAREQLRAFFAASNALVSAQTPDQVLQDIVRQMRVATKAAWVSVALINTLGQPRHLFMDGAPRDVGLTGVIRSDGLSMKVMQTGKYISIEDTLRQQDRVHPEIIAAGIRASLCLPLAVRGIRIGVMWLHYDETHVFSEFEIEAFQLYATKAALAYDSARRMNELEHLRETVQQLAEAKDSASVLEGIVQNACSLLHADSAAIWSYDAERNKFIAESSVAAGIPKAIWTEFQREKPRVGQTAETVMKQGWLEVEAVDRQRHLFLGEATQRMLTQIGVQSFTGIALKVDKEHLGVLYVNYNYPHRLSQEEREVATAFSNHAALALKKAKLVQQITKARNVAQVVADVTVLENLDNTLTLIAKETQNALDADAIALFVYDAEQRTFRHPATLYGVRYPERVQPSGVEPDSLVVAMLTKDKPYTVEDLAADPLFKTSRFRQDEAIAACVAVPLIVRQEKVGVIFVNYRVRHRFAQDELANLQLFANQAAVAIRNAQLYEKRQKHTEELEILNQKLRRRSEQQQAVYLASKAISSEIALEQRQLLERILAQAVTRIKPARAEKCTFGAIQLYEAAANTVHIECIYPPEAVSPTPSLLGQKRRLDGNPPQIGISGRAILARKPQRVADVHADPNYINFYPSTRSQLNVPLQQGDAVLGVLSLESDQLDAFDREDEQALEALAELSVIAIQSAQQYKELQHRTTAIINSRTALAWMGMASSTWRHTIDKHAITIREQIALAKKDLSRMNEESLRIRIEERLAMIERLTTQLLEKPITPPLSTEEGLKSIPLNSLIRERSRQLWQNEAYKIAELKLNLLLPEDTTIRVSPEWLRRAFDILVDNAVEAVKFCEIQEICIGSRLAGRGCEIFISDTGPGIREEIRAKIALHRIDKPEDAKGLGMGLLMAQTIVQTYGGEIRIGSTDSNGTTMVIWLPL